MDIEINRSVVMYWCDSWTVKKAERQRIDAFELWRWRRLLRVPWTARRSKQSILKEISPGISMKGIMLKLKLQYFGQRIDAKELMLLNWPRIDPVLWPSHVKSWLTGKDSDAGRDWGQEEKAEDGEGGWDGWMASLTRRTWVWVISGSWWWTGRPGVLRFMGSQRVRHVWTTELNYSTKIEIVFKDM